MTLPVDAIVNYVLSLKESQKGSVVPSNLPENIVVQSFAQTKLVSKPWGFEMWLAHGEKFPYALKIIHIKKGTKTSLQYHNQKVEHNVVFAGEIKMHYEDSKTKEIVTSVFTAGSVINVCPPAVHRVEAVTDVLLVEVSSNHLDDVIRLQDDYKRPDGRIELEHAK